MRVSEHHTILGGKVHIYKRSNSSSWQCASHLAGKNRRTTTKEDSLSKAKEFAGELKSGKLFREAAKSCRHLSKKGPGRVEGMRLASEA